MFRRWLRYAIVLGIALNGQVYRSIVQDGLEGIQGAFGAALGMGPTVGSAVDGMLDPFLTMTNTLWSTAMTGLVWPAFNLMIAGVFYAVAGALMAIVSLCLSLLAKIILSVLLAIGPVFMFCAFIPDDAALRGELGHDSIWSDLHQRYARRDHHGPHFHCTLCVSRHVG